MSRCFPFPPPGYAKKLRADEVNLLKKEKDRETKHKKEKKDREKSEGKDRKNKDRSDGKYRDKKDKKEKHREKKDRDKDKGKTSASDEKRLPALLEHNNGEKTSDGTKFLGKTEGNVGEIFTPKGKERDIVRKNISDAKKLAVEHPGYNDEKLSQNSHLSVHPKDSKFIQELGRRVRDDDRGIRNQPAGKFASTVTKRDEEIVKLVAKATDPLAVSKAKITKDHERRLATQGIGDEAKLAGNVMSESFASFDSKRREGMIRLVTNATDTWEGSEAKSNENDHRRLDGQGVADEVRFTGNAIAESLSGTVQTRNDIMPKPPDKDFEKRMGRKEKTKHKEADDKRKDKEKKSKRKNKDGDKEKKRQKSKEKSELKKAGLDKINGSNKNDPMATCNVKTSHVPSESARVAVVEGNLKKRKESDTNGFLSVNDSKPSKLPRPTYSQPLIENGSVLEACHSSVSFVRDVHGAVNDFKVGHKEYKVNGVTEGHALSSSVSPPLSSSKPLLTTSQVDQTVEVYRKPHPDSKYLNEILTVPKMEEWSDFVDHEWLFQHSNSVPKKLEVEPSRVDDRTLQVWSEPMRIESADVYALPYVFPY